MVKTGVALKRIEVFLGEDEVDEQVSIIKRSQTGRYVDSSGDEFGLYKASFKWNAVNEEKNKDKVTDDNTMKGSKKQSGKNDNRKDTSPSAGSSRDIEASLSMAETLSVASSSDHTFELRDISVVFPARKLSLITGATASGKTALLVRELYYFCYQQVLNPFPACGDG